MTAELLDLLVRMTPPSHRLEVVADNNNCGLATAKVVISANSHVKQRLADLRADLAVLEFECKLLSRLLYKLHNRFRNDRGYKALRILEKSGKCVFKESHEIDFKNLEKFTELGFTRVTVPLIAPVVEHVFIAIFIRSLCLVQHFGP